MTDPKATLLQLNQNLNILQQREAKFGGNAPLELLNQISDHQQAIALTWQAITGELDEAAWQEALKPLLLACRDGQVVNIETETYIAGNQIITHIYEVPPPPLPPAEAKERRELGILLNKVKQFWIEGVLEKSIHNITLIDLGKETQAEAVAHAWEQVLELPDQSRQILPPDKKISYIFNEMNRAMLILGSPGSGKTITLLQLARELITQTEQDASFACAVPVVFNLSTWTRSQPLIDWLVTELSAKYQIPKRIGRPWLENNRLLPLLDGLDEVKLEEQAACVEAINNFGAEFGLSGLVVCSRLEEYTRLRVRLRLNGAICLQPLTLEQVNNYLDAAGSRLDALRIVLQEDDALQALAQTPLTLGIMTVAYQNLSTEELTNHTHATLETRRKHLFDTYIERMLLRKGSGKKLYTNSQTVGWLSWLARRMLQYNQTIFLIEQIQPDWLSSRQQRWIYCVASRVTVGMIFGFIFGFIFGVIEASTLEQAFGLSNGVFIGLSTGIGGLFGFVLGLIIGAIGWSQYNKGVGKTEKNEDWSTSRVIGKILGTGLLFGLIWSLVIGSVWLFYSRVIGDPFIFPYGKRASNSLPGWIIGGWVSGFLLGVSGRAVAESAAKFNIRWGREYYIQTVETLSLSWRRALQGTLFGIKWGGGIGALLGFLLGITGSVMIYTASTDDYGLFWIVFIASGTVTGMLLTAIAGGLFGAMFGALNSSVRETKNFPNQGMMLSLRNAVFAGLYFGLPATLVGWVLFGVNGALISGPLFGLLGFFLYGGLDVIQHYTLRAILWRTDQLPRNQTRFLNHGVDQIFLQKVGGGYIFIHRLLLEHFATKDYPHSRGA